MQRVLIVEDDKEIRTLISDYAIAAGYQVSLAEDGSSALLRFEEDKPNIILLDIMLPQIDGFELLRRIRKESDIPIIMVSSKQEDTDKILALGLGADDYIEKPFSPRLLIAKITASLKRYNELSGKNEMGLLTVKDLTLDPRSMQLSIKDKQISLTAKEFELLKYFLEHKNTVLTRERLFDNVWENSDNGDITTVTVHIKKLREKIEQDPTHPTYIETVWGAGYIIRG